MKRITTPVLDSNIRDLRAGDIVNISGTILTARDQAHKRIIEKGAPCSLEGVAIFHAGPIITETYKNANEKENENNNYLNNDVETSTLNSSKFKIIVIGPTTSMRMNPYQADVIGMGAKIIIGKGGMDETVANALKNEGAVYLVAVGGCAALYVDSIKEISNVHWLDLGMPEAIWELKVESFGPLIVAMDSHNNSIFK